MITKNYIILSLMFTATFIGAATPDVAQLADMPQQEVNAKASAAEPSAQSSVVDKIKTVITSCGVGVAGLYLGLAVKAMSFEAIKNDPNYGTLINALAGLVLAKCGSSVVENVFDKFQSNVFVSAMAIGYISGDDAPFSRRYREDRGAIESINQQNAQRDFLNAQSKSDSELEKNALERLSTQSLADLVERQRLLTLLKALKKISLEVA